MSNHICSSARRRAFTLVELLIVITIIGVLVAMLLPAVTGAMGNAERVKCQTNLIEIAKAVFAYSSSSGNVLPTRRESDSATWPVLLVEAEVIEAPNTQTLSAQTSQTTTRGQNIFRCTAGEDLPGGSANMPNDPGSQGFWRSGSNTYKVDCWYYWNGTDDYATPEDGTRDYPSAAYGGSHPTFGAREAVRHPSQVVMLADGFAYNGYSVGSDKTRIAGRHWGDHGSRTATNLVYWDGHTGTLQRNFTDTNEAPILSRDADLKSDEPPFFRLSDVE